MTIAPIIVALAMGAPTGQATGTMSPTSDLSGNRVRAAGGLTSLGLAEIASQHGLNVRARGAVGNGTTDDTAAIQAAINTGRPVLCPAGYTFSVSGLTISTAGQRIYGGCALKLRDASNAPLLTFAAAGIIAEDLDLDGNKATQSAIVDPDGAVVFLTSIAHKSIIRRNYIHDAKMSGVMSTGYATGVRVEENRIEDVGFIAVRPSTGSSYPASRWVIARNIIESPGQDCVGTVAIQKSTITGNTCRYPTVSGFALEARCDDTTVSGNTVEGDGTSVDGKCVQVNDSRNVAVTGNTCTSLAGGILLAGGATSGGVSVTGNSLDSTPYQYSAAIEVDGSQVTTTLLNAYRYRATISGNIIENSPHAGILVNAASGVIVQGNSIHNWDTANDVTTDRFMGAIVMRTYSHDNIVQGNTIATDSPAWYRVGILECGDGGQAPLRNRILDNEVSGVEQDVLLQRHGFYQSEVRRRHNSTTAPAAYSWLGGQQVLNPGPEKGRGAGWMVSYPDAGSFGTAPTSHVHANAGTQQLLVNDNLTGVHAGMMVSVAGAGTGGAALVAAVTGTDRVNGAINLDAQVVTTVAAAAVTLSAPSFTDLPRVAPAGSRYSGTVDVGSIAAGTCDDSSIDLTVNEGGNAAQAGADCIVGLPITVPNGLIFTCRVTSTGHVGVRACNVTASPIDPPSLTYTAQVFNP